MKIFLKPGELCVCDRPTQVSTILGSCIAVTIFNQRLRVGAICHALLPKNPKGHDALRYVDSAISSMLQKLEAMGIGDLALKRNLISILSAKSNRGWEVHLESEKLYYLTIDLFGARSKTLPIPSGKCSLLVDKL